MVPLNTPLQHGQTVEIVAAKDGGPSLDWLNPELGYLPARARGPRCGPGSTRWRWRPSRAAARLVEKLLQREGRKAPQAGAPGRAAGLQVGRRLFEVVGKDEFSLRNIENLLRPPLPPRRADEAPPCSSARRSAGPAVCWWWAWAR
jgi:GTP pyrophosphokinase